MIVYCLAFVLNFRKHFHFKISLDTIFQKQKQNKLVFTFIKNSLSTFSEVFKNA